MDLKEDILVTGSCDNTTVIWNLKTFTKMFVLIGHTNFIKKVTISVDGSKVFTASVD